MVRNNGHNACSSLVGMACIGELRAYFAFPKSITLAPTQMVLQRFKVHTHSWNVGKVHTSNAIFLPIVLLKRCQPIESAILIAVVEQFQRGVCVNNVLEWVVDMACVRRYINWSSYLDAFCKQVFVAHLSIEEHT